MKVLLATDGSVYAEAAARLLSRFRLTPEDEITVFHSISWVPFKDDRESHYASLKLIKQEIAPRILDACVAALQPCRARISTAVEEGYPDRVIVEASARAGADLVVLGARGLRGLESAIIGSVTRAVAMKSQPPLLIVKVPQKEKEGPLSVLFATDGSTHAEATARLLGRIPFPDDTVLTVLHVIWSPLSDIPARYVLEIDDRMKDKVMKARMIEFSESEGIVNRARQALAGSFSEVRGMSKVGDPSVEILSMAESAGADITAVGSRGMRGIRGMLGSVSRNIVIHAPCSVLVGEKE